jgi:hypothetical protein
VAPRHIAPAKVHDPYSLDDNSYDIDRFYTTTTEDSEAWPRVRGAAAVTAVIRRMIEQREIPEYSTFADFLRDAAHHRLHYLTKEYHLPHAHGVLSAVALIDANERQQRLMKQERAAVESSRATLEQALAQRDWAQFREAYDNAKKALDIMHGVYADDMKALLARMDYEATRNGR